MGKTPIGHRNAGMPRIVAPSESEMGCISPSPILASEVCETCVSAARDEPVENTRIDTTITRVFMSVLPTQKNCTDAFAGPLGPFVDEDPIWLKYLQGACQLRRESVRAFWGAL